MLTGVKIFLTAVMPLPAPPSLRKKAPIARGSMPIVAHGEYANRRLAVSPSDLVSGCVMSSRTMMKHGMIWWNTSQSSVKFAT